MTDPSNAGPSESGPRKAGPSEPRSPKAGPSKGGALGWLHLSWADLVVFGLLLLLPFILQAVGSYVALGSAILVWGLAAMSLNLLLGYTGALSFGHAAFLGLGAYAAGLTLKHIAPNTLLALLMGVVVATVGAMILGLFVTRLRGIYFATFTIAFGQLFYFVAFQLNTLTGGDDGLRGFSRQPIELGPVHIDLMGSTPYFYVVLACFVIAVVVMRRIIHSPLGRSFTALRENVARARFLGLPVERYLWLSFVISGGLTGLAGALLALLINFAQVNMLFWTTSGEILMMAFLGGVRSFYGPLVGAAFYTVLQEVLSSYTANWMFYLGTLFVLFVLFFRGGLVGFFTRRS
ncbi:MAG TPA: branched-chain amino acid ABC transporter permease [Trueperaceae bacterium]|nr:branched-chain amino acid ABC transporter permease [Trueperaceae bacterium]